MADQPTPTAEAVLETADSATIDAGVRAAKIAAGLDPDKAHLPSLFIDHLPEELHEGFWTRQVDRFFDLAELPETDRLSE